MFHNMVKLGDIGSFAFKSHIKAGEGQSVGQYRFFTSSNEQSKYLNEYLYDFPALIFGTGGNASVHYCDTPFATSTDCLVFFTSNPSINLKTIYRFLSGNIHLLEAGFKGAGLKHISKKYLTNDIYVPILDVQAQQQIADVLDRASALIEKRKAQIEKLDLLVKSQFTQMFGDPVTNPMGWEKQKLGSLLSVEPQNGFYRPQSDYRTDGSGVPILRIDAFYNGKVTNWASLRRLECSDDEKKRYLLSDGDIVINRVNSIEYLGKCALIVGFSEDTVFESNMMRFHAKEELLIPVFLTHFLCLPYIYDQIITHAKKSVNQASINQKDVQDFDILIPPIALQTQFAVFVHQVEEQKKLLQQSLAKLEQNYKSLMQKSFRGEIF